MTDPFSPGPFSPGPFSHFDAAGGARMVDVTAKDETRRVARAGARVTMRPETLRMIRDGAAAKGDVLGVARLAGIMAAKKTAELIPLCHPLPIGSVELAFECPDDGTAIEITATVATTGRTGVEMEALTAVAVAALTVYDMCKSADRGMVIGDLRLLHKSGGKSGTYEAP